MTASGCEADFACEEAHPNRRNDRFVARLTGALDPLQTSVRPKSLPENGRSIFDQVADASRQRPVWMDLQPRLGINGGSFVAAVPSADFDPFELGAMKQSFNA